MNVNSSSSSVKVVISNDGRHSVSIESISSNMSQFVVSGISLPFVLSAHSSTSFLVAFRPNAAATYFGTIDVTFSSRYNSSEKISVSGTGISTSGQPKISVIPSSAGFGSVTNGVTNTQTLKVSNAGSASLRITQATISGSGFAYSGLTLPLTIAAGTSATFTASFDPTAAGSFSGTLTLTNNSGTPSMAVSLSGTGVAPILQLSASPASLTFGNVTTGTSAAKTVTLTNAGNADIALSQDTVSGVGFSVSGLGLPVTLNPGQSTSFSVDFAPAATGNVSGSLSVSSNANNSPTAIAFSGSGVASTVHKVMLSWTPGSSSYSGSNLYRATVSGGPYTKLDSTLLTTASYTDSNVTAGQTYYYVASEVNGSGQESADSNQVSATIP